MNKLPIEVLIILMGIGAVLLIWLALRFGRTIGIAMLVLGLLAVAVLGAAALATQAGANFQAAKATTEAVRVVKTQSTLTNIGLGLLVLVLLAMVAGLIIIVVYFVFRSSAPLPLRNAIHSPANLDDVMNVAQLTAINQLLALQQDLARSLRCRWPSSRRRSPWYVSAPFLPHTDSSMMGAFLEDDSEEWESWADEGASGGDLWGVH